MDCVLGQHDESGRKEQAIYYLNKKLGQHDESGRKEQAIYYLNKKFMECESCYNMVEKLCCGLEWSAKRLQQYMLYYTT
jgi:hypothetical protein